MISLAAESAVQVAGRDHRLHSIGGDAIAFASSAMLLAVTEQEIAAELDRPLCAGQTCLADQVRTHPRQLALRVGRETGGTGTPPRQNPISSRPGIPGARYVLAVFAVFIGIGTVRQRVFEQLLTRNV